MTVSTWAIGTSSATSGPWPRTRQLDTTVVTFDRHPATVVRPESAPLLLTDLEQKLELLAATGVDRTVVVPFDETRANETAEDFVTEVLVEALGAKLVVVGEDFHFGHGRKGNVALLTEMGARYGFEVVGLGLEEDKAGEAVSSTRIRRLLADGDVAGAARLLGRSHQVRGVVVHGDGRGGPELGYPTANLDVPAEVALPGEGIYACRYQRADGSVHGAAASVGHRPTFHARDGVPAPRGLPPRFRGRPLRRAGSGLLRGPLTRRNRLLVGRGPDRPDGPGRRRRPCRAGGRRLSGTTGPRPL